MTSLTKSRGYLEGQRRMIIGRSLAASLAGVVPVPILDDWLVAAIRRGTIRRIAESHRVDLDDEAVRAIADGPERPPSFTELAAGGLAAKLLRNQWRRLLIAFLAAKRARVAADNFAVATVFDHYCARLHVGMGLDGDSGKQLRALIDRARQSTPGGLSRHLFRRGLVTALRASVRAPIELLDLLTGGRVTKLLTSKSEVEATVEVDKALEAHLRSESSFLARSAAAIELQLASEQNPYLDNLIDSFDDLWERETQGSED